MPSVTYDFVPNQRVWVISDNEILSGVVSRVQIDVTGSGTTINYWVRLDGDTTDTQFAEDDVYANCQSTAGYQVVNYNGAVVSGATAYTPSGSPFGSPAVLTATITIDTLNVIPVSIDQTSSQTYQQVINTINGQLGSFGTATISDGNIKVTSSTIGTASKVSIVDVDLFSSLNGFNQINTAVDGLGAGALEAYGQLNCS